MSFFNNEKNICKIENASYEYKRMKEIGKFSRNRIFLLKVEEITTKSTASNGTQALSKKH